MPKHANAELFAKYRLPNGPGIAFAVSLDGETVCEQAFGLADIDRARPLTLDSLFNAGSIAKQVIAGAVALLVEDGELALEDKLGAHVPEISSCTQNVCVEHLLHHCSGLRDPSDLFVDTDRQASTNMSAIHVLQELAARDNLHFFPGEMFAYSNTGYLLLGLIVSRLSGLPVDKFVKKRLFDPIGMHESVLVGGNQTFEQRVRGYRSTALDRERFAAVPATSQLSDDFQLWTSVGDCIKWARNIIGGGATSNAWRRLMLTPGRLNSGRIVPYVGGLFLGRHRDELMLWHTGELDGFRGALHILPGANVTVAVLANQSDVDVQALAGEMLDEWHV